MRILSFILFTFVLTSANAQSPIFEKTTLPNCDCSVNMPKDTVAFGTSDLTDGTMYYKESKIPGNVTYGAFVVKFKTAIESSDMDAKMTRYLDLLTSEYKITTVTGFKQEYKMNNDSSVKGKMGFWKDDAGNKYEVKVWINNNKISILYIYTKGELPAIAIADKFLDGFSFTNPKPETKKKVIVGTRGGDGR